MCFLEPIVLYSICERHPNSVNQATWRTEAADPSTPSTPKTIRLEEGGRAVGREDLLASLRGVAVGQRELEVLGEELLDVGAADVLGLLNLNDLEDVDGAEAGTVTGGHVLVEGLDGVGAGHLAVLTVHVVSAGARVVADPDANVLDLEGVLLVDLVGALIPRLVEVYACHMAWQSHVRNETGFTDLVEADDLTVGLLDLPQAGEEVPETALGNNRVGRKDAHTVELRSGLGVSGQMAPNDLVFLQATCGQQNQRCLTDRVNA